MPPPSRELRNASTLKYLHLLIAHFDGFFSKTSRNLIRNRPFSHQIYAHPVPSQPQKHLDGQQDEHEATGREVKPAWLGCGVHDGLSLLLAAIRPRLPMHLPLIDQNNLCNNADNPKRGNLHRSHHARLEPFPIGEIFDEKEREWQANESQYETEKP